MTTPLLLEHFDKSPSDRLMTQAEVAALLNVSTRLLEDWRAQQQPPPFVKLGRLVRYRTGEVRDWIKGLTPGPTRAPAVPPTSAVVVDGWGINLSDPSLGLDEPLMRGGRPRSAPTVRTFAQFLSIGEPEDAWLFARMGPFERPVDLSSMWAGGATMEDGDAVEWLTLGGYANALGDAIRHEAKVRTVTALDHAIPSRAAAGVACTSCGATDRPLNLTGRCSYCTRL